MARRGRIAKRETLEAFTERAKKAVDLNVAGIPPIVYLPAKLRAHDMRLTVDHLRITSDPPTIAENHLRIAEADPLGLLIAIMNGQPIPSFQLEGQGERTNVRVRYIEPDFETRKDVAKWLAQRVTYHPYAGSKPTGAQARRKAHQADYDAMIDQMVQEDGTVKGTD